MNRRSTTVMMTGMVVILSLTLIIQAAVNDNDRRRLDLVKANHAKEIEAAKDIYDRAVERANQKLRQAYDATLRHYEIRGDEEAVAQLKAELQELAGQEQKPAFVNKTLGHFKLIESLGPVVQTAEGRQQDSGLLAKNKYMLLYFSAQWCPPCRAFSPTLVEFFNNRKNGDNFDLVLVSSDRSEKDMFTYMNDYKMPWLTVPFNHIAQSGLVEAYSGRGIPNLVLLGQDGKVLSGSFRGEQYVGPGAVLEDLAKLLDAQN